MIVQLLEDTSAVLSLGKLCEEHGYSYEWVSGQKRRLTKEGKTIVCKTDNFVPLVVPGLSSISGAGSSSTSPSQDSSSTSSSTCPSPTLERSDEAASVNWCETHPETKTKIQKRDGNRDSDNRLRDLPEWLEEITDNLEDTKALATAQISQDSDSERSTKVASI